ncbi:hypothetical protein [Anaerophilus nitritogenes]|uniref:hypothetical protein n=1 Tax=Anaerophilus nitritogenes TaxID=2498136 RepID=UPI00101B5BEB|nr:hypothetical protein [Anaerophilus nitritogenes]
MSIVENEIIDFDKIVINQFQVKILKLLKRKDRLNIYQIHGFFNFIDFEKLIIDLQDLERNSLILKDKIGSKPDDYKITIYGNKFLIFLKKQHYRNLGIIITVISSLLGILTAVLHLLGHL